MIGSYLRDTAESLRFCYACQTESATRVSFEPISELAPPELERIHGTRCDACGDVRLYQLLKNGTTDAEIRSELDVCGAVPTIGIADKTACRTAATLACGTEHVRREIRRDR